MSTPPITATMHHMIQEWEQEEDNRWVFLRCYTMMTENMLSAIEAGEFFDGGWFDKLLHHFADYYFQSLDAFEDPQKGVPPVWDFTHRAALNPHTHVLQNLLLGINAHINYDLVMTLVDLLDQDWRNLSPVRMQRRYEDYCVVNDIIAVTLDDVQDTVVENQSPNMDLIDKLLGPADEWLASQLINSWREQVWNSAAHILDTPDRAERETIRQDIEHKTLQRSKMILMSG